MFVYIYKRAVFKLREILNYELNIQLNIGQLGWQVLQKGKVHSYSAKIAACRLSSAVVTDMVGIQPRPQPKRALTDCDL